MDQANEYERTCHYERARDVAVAAAHEAACLIRRHAGRIPREDVGAKGAHDLVTEIDEEAQRIIVRVLEEAFPGYEVLAEEGAGTGYPERVEGYRWIIDPIDGTTNFTRGLPPYSASIGLQHGAQVVAGVVLDVAAGELFTAVRGRGLYVNGVRAGVSGTASLEESLLTTGLPYVAIDYLEPYLDVLGEVMRRTHGFRRTGSAAVNLAYVAAGRFDGFFETGLSPWDVAAGLLLVEEGGGRVTDLYDRPDPILSQHLLASNGHLHGALLEMLRPLREA